MDSTSECSNIIKNMVGQVNTLSQIVNGKQGVKTESKAEIEARFEGNKKIVRELSGLLDLISDVMEATFVQTVDCFNAHKQKEGETQSNETVKKTEDNKNRLRNQSQKQNQKQNQKQKLRARLRNREKKSQRAMNKN